MASESTSGITFYLLKCVFGAYLLLPPASTERQCRTPGPSLLSPTSAQSLPHKVSLCFAPGSSHRRAKPHGVPTPRSSHHPTINQTNKLANHNKVMMISPTLSLLDTLYKLKHVYLTNSWLTGLNQTYIICI